MKVPKPLAFLASFAPPIPMYSISVNMSLVGQNVYYDHDTCMYYDHSTYMYYDHST